MGSEYEKSGFAAPGERLKKLLESMTESDETLRRKAENELKPDYESARRELLNNLKKENEQDVQKGKAISDSYAERRQQVNEAYDRSHKRLENELNMRGMGRSSLVATEGTALENERNRELNRLNTEENTQKQELKNAASGRQEQAEDELKALSGSYAEKLEKRIASLKDSSRTAQVSLELQLAALQQQGYEAYMNNLMKEKEFAAKHPEKEEKQEFIYEETPKKSTESAKSLTDGGNSAVQSAGAKLKGFLAGIREKSEKVEALAKTKPEKKERK